MGADMYETFYSTNFALILPLLQIYNLYMPVKTLSNQHPGVHSTTRTATGEMKISFCPTIAGPVRRHQARRIWSSGKGNLKDRFIISSTLHPAFITYPSLLRGKICSHTRCMYHDLERRRTPELPQQTASSNPEAARKPRTLMKYQPFLLFIDHSCNPDSTFLLVAMYKSLCVCGCQWGVYASTWPK